MMKSQETTPDEMGHRELELFLQLTKDFKKRKVATSNKILEQESTCLEALAKAASLADNTGEPGSSSGVVTTKHPRHRPGCSCIVCNQPPSGKGKHKPTCNCNVCLTVKRHFKTLMMRKKKRQLEQEAELARKNQQSHHQSLTDETEVDSRSTTNSGTRVEPLSLDEPAPVNKELDLNFHPEGGADLQVSLPLVSMRSLLQLVALLLETYMKRNGLMTLASEQWTSKEAESQDKLNDRRSLQEQGQTSAH